ncbi:KdsC family phosphatase [Marilutibacter alkalisoli]|uniref:3-deoxy-D-manno-octulosonate 8-phosphate phosphatase KdsC n=1 Tax=Marilutibacter alkalisoli TaxID=2591633 RepID=A0A514BPN6_9GAMM|nr:HAD hydrolase family protein [Lysobacter alkalisoli]QDH69341.1 phenylphosphate carboxylase subunit delta [Lysobacter alkalisoli]
MPYSHLNDYPADIRERAARIRLACFDVDGTLTDGQLGFDSEGREHKAFHVHDGMGLVMLRKSGIAVAFVTARTSAVAERRAGELGVEAHTGVKDKLACVQAIAQQLGIGLDQVAFMGDDLPDLKVMLQVGLSVAPANAHPWTRERVHWRTHAGGGHGAVRELCDLLLAAQGHAEALLSDLSGDGAGSDGTRA